jgi:hypothetical protein
MRRWGRVSVLAVCLVLAIVHTWPLGLSPAKDSLNENADAQLNEWILAWVEHQLPRDPRHLFDANIFYPAHDALAFSEPLIVPALMGAPIAWLGGSPVLVYNLVLIAGFTLTAFATCVLVEAWTGSTIAGLIAGSLFAFNTHTLTRLAHIQGIHLYGLPARAACSLTVSSATTPRLRAAALLAASLVLLAYTSGYLIVFAAVMIAIAIVTRAGDWWPRARRVVPALALAGLAAGIAIVPIYLPYRRVEREQHMVRALDMTRDFSATPGGYLASAARVHVSTWSGRFFKDPVNSFFPGFVILVLAVIALVASIRARDDDAALTRRRVVMLAAIGAAGFLLSLGMATPVYGWLFDVFPPMQGLRAAARFGNLFLLAVAVLGGIGAARILASDRARWHATAIGVVLLVLVNVESLRAPFTYTPFVGIPDTYVLLAREPGPVVLVEQPFFPRWAIFQNGPYVLASTAHWRPLMNGYSGYTPDTYQPYADTFWYFPEERAIDAMKQAGVTHVMVHPSGFPPGNDVPISILDSRADFELMAIGRDLRLYRLKR